MTNYRDILTKLGITACKSGKYLCPKCSSTRTNKTDRCLSVTYELDAVLYKCHNCDFSGCVSFDNRYIPTVKREFKRPAPPKTVDNKKALYDYFDKRAITQDVVDFYDVGINDKKQIIFPYYKNGELVNIKYRTNLGNGKKTFIQESDAEKTFFAMDKVKNFDKLVIVEGEMDVLACCKAGIEEVVSVPQGASENKLECIDNCFDWLNKFESYIIAVDNDEPGNKLKNNLLARLDKYKCRVVNFGEYKDANEVLISEGNTKLMELIYKAEFIKLEGISDFKSHEDKIMDFYENGYQAGYSTGWSNLDKLFTIKTGYLMIITGIPSRGKSFFVDNMLFNLSKKDGLKHLLCSFENSIESHFARLASMHQGKSFSKSKGMTEDEVKESLKFVDNYFMRLEIDRLWNVDQIIEQLEYAVKRYGINTLVIDPYNRLDNQITEREEKYIGSILAKLAMAAKRLNVLIIFIAHPKKFNEGDKMPNMYSISGSADWYNMADIGVIIHRDRLENGKLENKMKVIVQKVKDFHLGNPSGGEAMLEYLPDKYILFDYIESNWQGGK
jgi:twinkle protein